MESGISEFFIVKFSEIKKRIRWRKLTIDCIAK